MKKLILIIALILFLFITALFNVPFIESALSSFKDSVETKIRTNQTIELSVENFKSISLPYVCEITSSDYIATVYAKNAQFLAVTKLNNFSDYNYMFYSHNSAWYWNSDTKKGFTNLSVSLNDLAIFNKDISTCVISDFDTSILQLPEDIDFNNSDAVFEEESSKANEAIINELKKRLNSD